MARLKQIVVDAHHAPSLARFWAGALDGFSIRAYDDAELARLAADGLTPETDPIVILDGPHGLEVCFQQVPVAPMDKKPLHLDLAATDRPAEVARLIALGASVRQELPAHTWMLDPEGNDFCITDA